MQVIANKNTGLSENINDVDKTVFPDAYHRPLMPLEVITLTDVKVYLNSFSTAICQSTESLEISITAGTIMTCLLCCTSNATR